MRHSLRLGAGRRRCRRRAGGAWPVLEHHVADDGDRPARRREVVDRRRGGSTVSFSPRMLTLCLVSGIVIDDRLRARRRHRLHAAGPGSAADAIDEVRRRAELVLDDRPRQQVLSIVSTPIVAV